MSDVIRLLPESVANLIAAGEVVTAPSSAVKELLDNAIDAGATSIKLEIVNGGKTLIHILDNGCGMSPTDARMAFEKHATSKIREAEDLYAIHTMGFRGEALASIAAVSQVELRTRRASDELGTEIVLSGSKVQSIQPVVTSVGTSIKVKDLFFNIPARRRYLKRDNLETKPIITEFDRCALVNPHVALSLYAEGKLVKELPATSLKERIISLMGRSFAKTLLPINYESDMISISGFVAHPTAAKLKGAQQFFFVNNRFMRHSYFCKAIELAFEDLIPQGAHPCFFVYFTAPTSNIDVNLRPDKSEVRFLDEGLIWTILRQLVRVALSDGAVMPVMDFDRTNTIEIPTYTGRKEEVETPANFHTEPTPSAEEGYARRVFMGGSGSIGSRSRSSVANSYDIDWDTLSNSFDTPKLVESELFDTSPAHGKALHHGIFSAQDHPTTGHLIYKGRYIVTSMRRNLALIDLHRAHERILYERYRLSLLEGKVEVEQQIFPQNIEFDAQEQTAWEELSTELQTLGFILELEQGQTYVIKQTPVAVRDAEALIRQFITRYYDMGHLVDRDTLIELLALSMSEANAYAYGTVLSRTDADELLAQLFATTDPHTSPRGRTIIATFQEGDIDARFL